jgi:hypothetical protein
MEEAVTQAAAAASSSTASVASSTVCQILELEQTGAEQTGLNTLISTFDDRGAPVQRMEERKFSFPAFRRRAPHLLATIALLSSYVIIGSVVYVQAENGEEVLSASGETVREGAWSTIDAIYFCFVTCSTVGYGDFSPSKPGTKMFTIFMVRVQRVGGMSPGCLMACGTSGPVPPDMAVS